VISPIRSLRQLFCRFRNGSAFYRYNQAKESQWLGGEYGGFYILPTLSKDSIVYSFGIGRDVSFDLEIIKKFGCKVWAFDPTPESVSWVEQMKLPSSFVFSAYGVSDRDTLATMYLPKNHDYVSGSIMSTNFVSPLRKVEVELRSLGTIMKSMGHERIDLLKMDIEGAEYSVIDYLVRENLRICQIAVEFHARMLPNGVTKTRRAIDTLQNHGYRIFGMSPRGEEISFVMN
jgi:FkbM family methyltransferase